MQVFEGNYQGADMRMAIVVSRFNDTITKRLVEGAVECFKKQGINEENLALCWVPGAFELPLIAKQFAKSQNYDAVLCLGCVIRGETSHYDYVCSQTASGIMQASLATEVPVIFGVLTVENVEQAFARSGIKGGNLGFQNALVALEMADLSRRLKEVPC